MSARDQRLALLALAAWWYFRRRKDTIAVEVEKNGGGRATGVSATD